MTRLYVRTLLVLTLALPAAAQEVYDGYQVHQNFQTGAYTRAAAGEFTGDRRRDVCVIVGGKPWIIADVDSLQAVVELTPQTMTATDVAVAPGATEYGLDLLLTTSNLGLQAWTLDEIDNDFEQAWILGGNWVNATSLHCADVNNDGLPDIVGLSANGMILMRRLKSSSGYSTDNETLTAAATSAVTLSWQSPASGTDWKETAFVRGNNLEILAHGGTTPTHTFTANGTPIVLDRLPIAAVHDRLLWITRNSTNTQDEFRTFRPPVGTNPPISETELPIGAFSTSGLAVGAVGPGDDNYDDVVVVGKAVPDYKLFKNFAGNANSFGTGMTQVLVGPFSEATTMTNQNTRPLLADFDNDGDADLFVAVQGDHDFTLQRNVHFSETAWRIPSEAGGIQTDGVVELYMNEPGWSDFVPTHIEGEIYEFNASTQELAAAPWCTFEVETRNGEYPTEFSFDCLATPPCANPPISTGGFVYANCEYKIRMRPVVRELDLQTNAMVNVLAGPDTSLLYSWSIDVPTDGIVAGTNPLPRMGPAPVGTLPPRRRGSKPPPQDI